MRKFLLAILVDNKPGVLTHVAGLISRRAFNIESINAGYTEEEAVTRINIVVSVDSERELEQVKHQLSKLIDVVKIVNLTEVDNITRELVLIKVRAKVEDRADLINIVNIFRAKIVDVSKENVVIELTGEESKINAICEVLSDYEILEVARTGAIALSRGPVPVKQMEEN
ncbi:MAG: acetolactate synthase small subunit [Schwartzia sp.]|nr:acetolactate synthase small subunit [Schwartzia sp. (in: firmicutes)]MBO6236648.1 acetolactate synthase small subunit [Schwartzia sp. (in: firmicutes)]MBO6294225.1 acetolactate synthase small subunit [Schwartzia sp. (in: firmicutes)]MBP3690895.1 acetolactate synthase small subunit [Schwartzia sp. (in: firmicutes)]